MAQRADNVVGAMAGLVALGTIVVFGYLVAVTPGGGLGWLGGHPKAAPDRMAKREQIVDRDYKFRLTAPDPSWRVFDHAAAEHAWPDTNAAMVSDHGFAQLSIARVGDIPLATAEAVVAEWSGAPTARTPLQWNGIDAVELVHGDGDGAVHQRVFVRDGYMYRFVLSGFGRPLLAPDRVALWDAFALEPGTVAPAPYAPAPRDVRGPDWKIASGAWQSASAGLAVRPPTGWRLLTGRELRRVRGDVDVMLTNDAAGCYVSLHSSAVFDPTQNIGPATLPVEMAGEHHDMIEVAGTAWSRAFLDVVHVDGVDVVVNAWGPTADGDRAVELMTRALAGITRLAPADRDALAAELMQDRHDPAMIGLTWADRGGMFIDYASGIAWMRPPDRAWRITRADDAAQLVKGAVLVAHQIRSHVTFALAPDPDIAGARPPTAWIAEELHRPAKKIDLTGLHASLRDAAEVSWVADGVESVHQVAAFVDDDGHALRVHIYGTRAAVAAARDQLANALGGTLITTVTPVEDGTTYVNRRWGFAMELRGWQHTSRADGNDGTDQSWNLGDRELIGVSVLAGLGAGDPVALFQGRALASAALGRGVDLSVKRATTTIGHEPATVESWYENQVYVAVITVEHHDLIYTLFVRGTETTRRTLEQAFRFVDSPAGR